MEIYIIMTGIVVITSVLTLLLSNKNIRKWIRDRPIIIISCLVILIWWIITNILKRICTFFKIDSKCPECHGGGYCHYDNMTKGYTYEECRKCYGSGHYKWKIPFFKK